MLQCDEKLMAVLPCLYKAVAGSRHSTLVEGAQRAFVRSIRH